MLATGAAGPVSGVPLDPPDEEAPDDPPDDDVVPESGVPDDPPEGSSSPQPVVHAVSGAMEMAMTAKRRRFRMLSQ